MAVRFRVEGGNTWQCHNIPFIVLLRVIWELFSQNHPAGLAFARLFVEDVAGGQSEAVLETLGALRPDRA